MTIIVAVDPGKSGAIACLVDGRPVIVEDMPADGKEVCPVRVTSILHDMGPDAIALEQVGARPNDRSAQRSFNFGVSFGILRGICEPTWPTTRVRPTTWRRHHGLPSRIESGLPEREWKDLSRLLALDLYPHLDTRLARKKDVDRAEACLIGQWLHDTQHNQQETA
ncbi:MAG: hypothetical protein ACPHCN_18410 [Mycobacterium sp.]